MRTARGWFLGILALGVAVLVVTSLGSLRATPATDPAIHIGPSDVGGVVRSAHGPEAGVWVIALTNDLPTRYAKIVVTDDQGRYLLPGLPNARYTVWVRGYGLVDGPKMTTTPGKMLNLTAIIAPDLKAAAYYYPAVYWYSLLKIPDKTEFPGTGPTGNGIAPGLKNQDQWIDLVKTDGCEFCHQLGNMATRTISPHLGTFPNSEAAWARRIQSGQAGTIMTAYFLPLTGQRLLKNYGDWTDAIAQGELPFAKPPRPQGIERNVVITEWDWATPTSYLHDEISTDKRHPTHNAYGKLYGSTEDSSNDMPILDPVRSVATQIRIPVVDPATPEFGFTDTAKPLAPSIYWGNQVIWGSQSDVHNPMFDENGLVWLTTRIRPADNPAYCKAGGANPSAAVFPLNTSGRQSGVYDPKTGKWMLADLCFSTQHLQFAYDADDTIWYGPGGGGVNVVGWLNAKQFLQTGDANKAQGWTPFILDTTGTGKRTAAWTEPGQASDPAKDQRINADPYGLGISPVDGTVWGSTLGVPGKITRVNPGPNPPQTALTEVYEPPENNPAAAVHGYSPHGMDISRDGIVWAPLASGHLASFDRSKCRGPLNGPAATGQHCPEGWTLYQFPGPQFKGLDQPGSAEAAYFVWVDQFNTFGLGANVPYATGNGNEGLLALVNGKWVVLRIPYPLGFFEKNIDGRIDDAKLGWKGRGLWTTFGSRAPFHMETGKGTRPKALHFQLRPNPLAE